MSASIRGTIRYGQIPPETKVDCSLIGRETSERDCRRRNGDSRNRLCCGGCSSPWKGKEQKPLGLVGGTQVVFPEERGPRLEKVPVEDYVLPIGRRDHMIERSLLLSEIEREIFIRMGKDMAVEDIAAAMDKRVNLIKTHLSNIYTKLRVPVFEQYSPTERSLLKRRVISEIAKAVRSRKAWSSK